MDTFGWYSFQLVILHYFELKKLRFEHKVLYLLLQILFIQVQKK